MKASSALVSVARFMFAVGGVMADGGQGAKPAPGKTLYETNCGSCHQLDGGGVPMMQPELIAIDRANGPKGGVIEMILKGSEAIEPGMSEYSNLMPAFDYLSDNDIALIASYVRTHFENDGGGVTADDVKSRRSK